METCTYRKCTNMYTLILCNQIYSRICTYCTHRCEDSRIVVEVGGDSLHFYHSVHVSRVSYQSLKLFIIMCKKNYSKFTLSLTPNTVHVPPPLLLVATQCTHPPPLLILPPLLLQSSSWLLLLFFTILLIWYIILATSYCYKANQRRRQALEDLYDINKPI